MKCDKCGYSDNGSGDWAHACGPVAIQQAPVMNERIEEIWIQSWTTEAPGYDYVKFAELIIRECCIALNPMLRDMISRGQAYDMIKKHFGVEE